MTGAPRQHCLGLWQHNRRVRDLRAPRRVGCEIEALPRAVPELHIGERVRAAHREVLTLEPLVPRPCMRTCTEHRVAPVELPVGRVAPPRRLVAVHERRERNPVALHRNLDAHGIAQGREHVDVLREAIDDRAPADIRLWRRIADDAQHVVALLEPPKLLLQPMVPELFTVIGRHHDVGVVPHPAGSQRVQHPPQLLVHITDHPEVLTTEVSHLDGIAGRRGDRVAQRCTMQRMWVSDGFDRIAHVGVVVEGGPPAGRRVRGMGPEVAGVSEPRTVLSSDPRDEPIGEEGGDTVLGGPIGLGLEGRIGAHPLVSELLEPTPPRAVVAGQAKLDVEPREDALVGVEPRIVGTIGMTRVDPLIGVAPERGLVARPERGASDVVEPVVEGSPVAHHTVVELIGAGVQACSPRRARRGLAVVPSEPNATRSEAIEVRRTHHGMTRHRQAVAPELVQRDEQDVGTGHGPSLAEDPGSVLAINEGRGEARAARAGRCLPREHV